MGGSADTSIKKNAANSHQSHKSHEQTTQARFGWNTTNGRSRVLLGYSR